MAVKARALLNKVDILVRGANAYHNLKSVAISLQAKFSVDQNANEVIGAVGHLNSQFIALNSVINEPDIDALAQFVWGDNAYNHAAEVAALTVVIQNAIDSIIALIPKQNGFNLLHSYQGNVIVPRNITAAQLAPIIPILQTIVDAID